MSLSIEEYHHKFIETINLVETCLQINEVPFPVCVAALSSICAQMCKEHGIAKDLFAEFWDSLRDKQLQYWDKGLEGSLRPLNKT